MAHRPDGSQIHFQHSPTGTFNFIGKQDEKYTLPQIIDIINDGLLTQKYVHAQPGQFLHHRPRR